jgi:hypothetical protein
MTHLIIRFATITHAHAQAAGLITQDTVGAALAHWKGDPLAEGINRFSTASRLKPLPAVAAFVAAVTTAFPCNLILSDGRYKHDGNGGTRWTIGLRHRLADIFCATYVDEVRLPALIDRLPSLCDKVRQSIPDGEGMGFLSAVEVYDLAAIANMTFPDIGRFAPLALADLVVPEAAVHGAEHRILDSINKADASGPKQSEHAGRILLNWYRDGETVEAMWRHRLEWLTKAAAI